MRFLIFLFLLIGCASTSTTPSATLLKEVPSTATPNNLQMENHSGYFDFKWNDEKGQIILTVKDLDQEFLYVNSLAAGIGSNDIGLDRGQLGDNRVVHFTKVGPKLLLVQRNLGYRAISDNEDEVNSVAQAFAQSVLAGFKIISNTDGGYQIDMTEFLIRDAHNVVGRLQRSNQGSYKLDKKRSAIFLPRCKSFPDNTEFEATLTFAGTPKGGYIRSVTPTPEAVTVRQHHSFVRLPDDGYTPRKFDPRSGYNAMSFMDYASPINQDITTRYIPRHRLKKKDPNAAMSEAVEPIVYYVDRGAPEPVKSALIEGASWWNQAYEAAGFKDAFIVKEMPADADPMDVRYNLIQWVHRSTRGWSYGASVRDPRTGEIIKGHVSLGSLRVRQDYLIAQGLFSPFANGSDDDSKLMELAIARLKQLSAHEVGHTLGISHNFASSTNNRASVMDYPHPVVDLVNSQMNIDNVYDDKIGAWDKQVIKYGYSDFAPGTNEHDALQAILKESNDLGLRYISDRDARPQGGSHPEGHLWDNGENPITELERMSAVRKAAIANFGEGSLKDGQPMATLENVFVPLYLSQRYQVEAVSKLIGGMHYDYAIKGDPHQSLKAVNNSMQIKAVNALLNTISPSYLSIPESVISMIPPMPIGYGRGREHFKIKTGNTFDPLSAAESAMDHTMNMILNANRLARINEFAARGQQTLNVSQLFQLMDNTISAKEGTGMNLQLALLREKVFVKHLMKIAADSRAAQQVQAEAMLFLQMKQGIMKSSAPAGNMPTRAHDLYLGNQIKAFFNNPSDFELPPIVQMPDGSPIGCGFDSAQPPFVTPINQ